MKKKASTEKVIKEKTLDAVFSKYIRTRDKRCVKCGTIENLQCAHIFSRTARSVRWDELNAITLCYKCHFFWAHHNPIEFTEFVKKRLGDKMSILKRKHNKPKQWTNKEKLKLKKYYEQSIIEISK